MDWQHGALTRDQVDLIIRCLPVDISFADENDVLVYWHGDTYKTCDARYIGRDIRDCHPKETLAGLEEVLRRFKAGSADTFECWKRRKNRLRYTRYVAVRDGNATYRGILEINQDVTRMRELEGEQPLLAGEELAI